MARAVRPLCFACCQPVSARKAAAAAATPNTPIPPTSASYRGAVVTVVLPLHARNGWSVKGRPHSLHMGDQWIPHGGGSASTIHGSQASRGAQRSIVWGFAGAAPKSSHLRPEDVPASSPGLDVLGGFHPASETRTRCPVHTCRSVPSEGPTKGPIPSPTRLLHSPFAHLAHLLYPIYPRPWVIWAQLIMIGSASHIHISCMHGPPREHCAPSRIPAQGPMLGPSDACLPPSGRLSGSVTRPAVLLSCC